jgi:hypothetical protein
MEPLIFMTLSEFSKELGISRSRVTQMVQEGLPVLRNGRLELGLALRWLSHTAVRRKSRWRDRGVHRVDELLAELHRGWHPERVVR